MADKRLMRTRATLPDGYQFPTPQHAASVDVGPTMSYYLVTCVTCGQGVGQFMISEPSNTQCFTTGTPSV